jgi:hypothetical protein
VEAEVDFPRGSAGLAGRWHHGRVGCDTGYTEPLKEPVRLLSEPGLVARLEDDCALVPRAEAREKSFDDILVVLEARRELYEEAAELALESRRFIEKSLKEISRIDETLLVGDRPGKLHREAE